MLLWLASILSGPSFFEALGKTTLRAGLAAAVSFLLALAMGPRLIAWLHARFREPVGGDSARLNALHQAKQWTPTLGGLFIVAALVLAMLLFGDLRSACLHQALLLALGLAAVGAWDDLTKLRTARRGISARAKLVAQIVVATLVAVLIHRHQAAIPGGLDLTLPLVGARIELGWLFVPWAVLVMVGSSNAVNLTDGLDGLAGGCVIVAAAALGIVAYASGHAGLAEYLNLPRLPGSHEMLVLVGGLIGAVLGFLWFNCHPAQVFMGDTGSLPLGGLLGLLAVVTRQEFLLLLVGGVFVVETLSVILQVASFRLRGRRVLRCAPLHHHFQFVGWPESKIVVRFWIAAALCAVVGISSLRFSGHDRNATAEALRAPRSELR